MNCYHARRDLALAALLVGMIGVGGCSSPPKVPESVTTGSRAETVLLSYRVEPPAASESANAAEGTLVSYQQPAPASDGLVRTLSIRFPHPSGNQELALVEVTTLVPVGSSSADGTGSGWRHWFTTGEKPKAEYRWYESWRMDIPRSDVDYLLAQLAASGYYSAKPPATSSTSITAHVDGVYVTKPWTNVAGLDGLLEHVCRHGHLVSRSPEARAAAGEGNSAPPAWQASLPPGVIPNDEAARPRLSPMTQVNQQRQSFNSPSYAGSTGAPGTAMTIRPPQPGSYMR